MQSPKSDATAGKTFIGVIALVIGIFALLSLLLWVFGLGNSFVSKTIDYVVVQIVTASGWSFYLVKGLVIILTIPFFWAVAKYTKIAFWHKPLKPSLRLYTNRYGVIIVLYVGLHFVSMYLASRDAFAFKYCANTPEGVKVFDNPMADPVYGIQCVPCTIEQIMALRRGQGKLSGPQRIDTFDPSTFAFFDGLTGEPLVWYYRSLNGEYELYHAPGIHPRTGVKLLPITAEVVAALTKEYTERQSLVTDSVRHAKMDAVRSSRMRQLSQYVDVGVTNQRGTVDIAVCVIDRVKSTADTEIERLITEALQSHGKHVVAGFIRPLFVQEKFAALFAGHFSEIRDLALQEFVDEIIIGVSSVSVVGNRGLQDLQTATLRIEWKKVDLNDGSLESFPTIELRGAGFDEESARMTALKMENAKIDSAIQAI